MAAASMVRAKICGITSWTDARMAVDCGAAALGFNFYPASPRAISPAAAWGIIRRLPPFVDAVGVFVNWSPESVGALAQALHLHAAQLHGKESPADAAAVADALPVIKAFRVARGFRPTLARYSNCSAFLLDGSSKGLWGGTGQRFDWSFALTAKRHGPIILAGGITPENVAEAIRVVTPYAVDVASGVESRPGKKDPVKLREFMREVARANRELAES